MLTKSNDRPFTSRIVQLTHKYTYEGLVQRCGRVRSTAWFNKLVHSSDPWTQAPPDGGSLDGLAALLHTSREHVAEMVALEWYGVRVTEQSDRVRSLAPVLDDLSEDDAQLVEALVRRLQPSVDDLIATLEG